MPGDAGERVVLTHNLWVTRRALDDIGLAALAGPTFSLPAYASRHPILVRFFDHRSKSVHGTARTQGVQATKGEVYNLHARNPIRGATWFDTSTNTVFLLAVVVDHDYTVFETRADAGKLMPSAADYADLAQRLNPLFGITDPDFFELARPDADELLERALANPGGLVECVLGHELPALMQLEVVMIDDEPVSGDVYAAVRFVERNNVVTLPGTLHGELADLLFPDAAPSDVDIGHGTFPEPRGKLSDDFILRWRRV